MTGLIIIMLQNDLSIFYLHPLMNNYISESSHYIELKQIVTWNCRVHFSCTINFHIFIKSRCFLVQQFNDYLINTILIIIFLPILIAFNKIFFFSIICYYKIFHLISIVMQVTIFPLNSYQKSSN